MADAIQYDLCGHEFPKEAPEGERRVISYQAEFCPRCRVARATGQKIAQEELIAFYSGSLPALDGPNSEKVLAERIRAEAAQAIDNESASGVLLVQSFLGPSAAALSPAECTQLALWLQAMWKQYLEKAIAAGHWVKFQRLRGVRPWCAVAITELPRQEAEDLAEQFNCRALVEQLLEQLESEGPPEVPQP